MPYSDEHYGCNGLGLFVYLWDYKVLLYKCHILSQFLQIAK